MVNCFDSSTSYQSTRHRADVHRSEHCCDFQHDTHPVQNASSVSLDSLKRLPSSRDSKSCCSKRSHQSQFSTRSEDRGTSDICSSRVTHCPARDPTPTKSRRSDLSEHRPKMLRVRSMSSARGNKQPSASSGHSLKSTCSEKKSGSSGVKRSEAESGNEIYRKLSRPRISNSGWREFGRQEKESRNDSRAKSSCHNTSRHSSSSIVTTKSETPRKDEKPTPISNSRENKTPRLCQHNSDRKPHCLSKTTDKRRVYSSRRLETASKNSTCPQQQSSPFRKPSRNYSDNQRGIDPPSTRHFSTCDYDMPTSGQMCLDRTHVTKPHVQANLTEHVPQGTKTRSLSLNDRIGTTDPGESCSIPKQSKRRPLDGRQLAATHQRSVSGHADRRAKQPNSGALVTRSMLPLSPVSTNSCRLRSPQNNSLAVRYKATPVKRTLSLGSSHFQLSQDSVQNEYFSCVDLYLKSSFSLKSPVPNSGIDSGLPPGDLLVSMHFSQRTCAFQEVRRSLNRGECVRSNRRAISGM